VLDPRYILFDNGSEVINKTMFTFLLNRNIRAVRISPRHPQSNGVVERLNRTFKDRLKALCTDVLKWTKSVDHFTNLYNKRPHSSTKLPPAMVFYGRLVLNTVALLFNTHTHTHAHTRTRTQRTRSRTHTHTPTHIHARTHTRTHT